MKKNKKNCKKDFTNKNQSGIILIAVNERAL